MPATRNRQANSLSYIVEQAVSLFIPFAIDINDGLADPTSSQRGQGSRLADIKAVIAGGDTYVFAADSPREEMIDYWFAADKYVYVAESDAVIVGTFWLKPNQPGLGSHVGNAAYMVSPSAKGKGIGRAMAEFSMEEARRLGFEAMQFNFVVKSNIFAVKLWKSVGFEIIGEIPDAFQHSTNGPTNAYIMYRRL